MNSPLIAIVGVLAIALVGCGTPPEQPAAKLELALVKRNVVFSSTQVFQVHVFKATTASGASVTCMDIPSSFRPGDQHLVPVAGSPRNLPWKGDKSEATVEKIQVPPDQKLVIVVLALAQWGSKGIHTVGWACQDNATQAEGSQQTISLTMNPTASAACTAGGNECWSGLTCQTGPLFPSGYCAKVACAGDQDCPPGTTCTSDDQSGNLCLARCEATSDCNTYPQSHSCERRLGPTAGGCAQVCALMTWHPEDKCP